jgi:hypothetical protein
MRFKFLSGDVNFREYGGKWISKKLNNGDFDYWMVIELINMNEHDPNAPFTYWVILSAVSPDEAKDQLESCCSCYGYELSEITDDEMKVEVLHGCGVSSPLWDSSGENYKKLMKGARKQARMAETLFGFYMDRPKNLMGATGWDVIKGDLIPQSCE